MFFPEHIFHVGRYLCYIFFSIGSSILLFSSRNHFIVWYLTICQLQLQPCRQLNIKFIASVYVLLYYYSEEMYLIILFSSHMNCSYLWYDELYHLWLIGETPKSGQHPMILTIQFCTHEMWTIYSCLFASH